MATHVTNWPWSGPVEQWIQPLTNWWSPQVTVNYAGDSGLERRIVTEIAGYGSQLGTLTDALLALAGPARPDEDPAIAKLRRLAAEVETAKRAARGDLEAEAEQALERLRRRDPAALRTLVARFEG